MRSKRYPRAEEHPDLAKLCMKLKIGNDGFEAGLKQVISGWPKKEKDNLPIVDIADTSKEYFWVKLPPQDMRAMYLENLPPPEDMQSMCIGNLAPSYCESSFAINDDEFRQCIIDGMTLSDNGFYVLLKAKSTDGPRNPRIIGHEINDQDYSIVAHSYAWKTKNGNLCLETLNGQPMVSPDLTHSVPLAVIQDLMSRFSKKIFKENPSFKYLTAGLGGWIPLGFPSALIPEGMKQGKIYDTSKIQFCIASNIRGDVGYLTKRLSSFSEDFKDAVLYLAPYFPEVEDLPDKLKAVNKNIESQLPEFISGGKANLLRGLTVDDFKIPYEKYENGCHEKAEVSTPAKCLIPQANKSF